MAIKTPSSQSIRDLTEQIEARKRRQQLLRDMRRKKQRSQQRHQMLERLIAPSLFLLSVLISALVLLFF